MNKGLLIVGLSLLVSAPQANAMEVAMKAMGGLNFNHVLASPNIGSAMEFGGFDAGGGFEFMFSPAFGLSTEAYFQRIKYTATAGNREIDQLNLPLLFLFRASPYLTFGLGGFFSYVLNKNGAALEDYDVGVTGMVGTMIPLGRSLGWVLQSRLSYGFVDQDTGAGQLNNLNIQALTGLRISFGGKKRR